MPGLISSLNAVRRRVRGIVGPRTRHRRPAILMYHRVARIDRDPWSLAVSPENFRCQLDLLHRTRAVLPLPELLGLEREGRLPDGAVAITFDDGYLDNLEHAAPALADAGLPATLFLATGPMHWRQPYWWDRLTAMILDGDAVTTDVVIGSEVIAITLDGPPPPADGWLAWQPPRTAREALYVRLWSSIRCMSPAEGERAMRALEAVLPGRPAAGERPMTEPEVRSLLATSPFELACHTVDHPDLVALTPGEAGEQLRKGKADVEALTGRTVTGFAYPYGRCDTGVAALVRDAGFTHACTTQSARLDGSDPFALPRLTAQDRPSLDWMAG